LQAEKDQVSSWRHRKDIKNLYFSESHYSKQLLAKIIAPEDLDKIHGLTDPDREDTDQDNQNPEQKSLMDGEKSAETEIYERMLNVLGNQSHYKKMEVTKDVQVEKGKAEVEAKNVMNTLIESIKQNKPK